MILREGRYAICFYPFAEIAAVRRDERGVVPGIEVTRDLAYGPDPRNPLDVFAKPNRQAGTQAAPVLVFVHGGGFIMGDKHTEGSPFYSNVGAFAARMGILGVVMTYRIAPANRLPSGLDDIRGAVEWLHANIARFAGDPAGIVLCGPAAGAAHVADYVAHRDFHAVTGGGIAGAVLLPGNYSTTTCHPNLFARACCGEDRAGWGPPRRLPACSTRASRC